MIVRDATRGLLGPAPLALTALYAVVALALLLTETVPLAIIAVSIPLAAALITLSIIDLHTMRLPDAITLPLIGAGPLLAFALGWDGVMWHVGSAAAGFLFLVAIAEGYRALRGRPGLGLRRCEAIRRRRGLARARRAAFGDGWSSCAALLAVLLAIILGRPVEASSRVPFGPFLAFGFWVIWLYGPIA